MLPRYRTPRPGRTTPLPPQRMSGRPPAARRLRAASVAVILLLATATTLVAQSGTPPIRRTAAAPSSAPNPAARDAACLSCHGMPTLGYRDSTGQLRRLAVTPAADEQSAHRGVACIDCHPSADTLPHLGASPRATCDGDCHATDSAGRPYTHAQQAEALQASIHGREHADNPGCLTCHGDGNAHAVTWMTKAPPAARMATCIACHRNAEMMARHGVAIDAVASYERSFHFKAIRFGARETAACTDCHTAHHVLPADDARSSVAPANVTGTCGQAGCHAGARLNFASSGANHLDLRMAQEPILFVEQMFFVLLTAGTMATLVVGIVLDIQKKFGWAALARTLWGLAVRRAWHVGASLRRRWQALRPVLARPGRATVRAARLVFYD